MYSDKAIIFYVFHDKPHLTADRLAFLVSLNPDTKIIACYGGPQASFAQTVKEVLLISKSMGQKLEINVDFFHTTVKEPWYNIDLLAADWFARTGKSYVFDVLLYIEYDVLLLNSVAYTLSKQKSFDLTACLTDNIETPEWDWLKRPSYSAFTKWREEHFQIPTDKPILNAFAPIHFISRRALEAYSISYVKNKLPACFLEIRYPNLLAMLGFTVTNAEMTPTVRWRPSYTIESVRNKIASLQETFPDIPQVFHPVYEPWHTMGPPYHFGINIR